ncbi:MAG: hypothetical protein ACRC9K_12110 [Afipia sp.]
MRGTREVISAADEIVVDDLNKAIVFNRAGGIAASIPEARVGGKFVDGWATTLKNSGTGLVTITPDAGTINNQTHLELVAGAGAFLWSHGGDYLALVFSNLDGLDGASIFIQPAAPGTAYAAGSIWIDSAAAQLDLHTLTGSPLAWADTGLKLKGLPGISGTNGIDGASALTVVRVVATANVDIATGLVNGATLDVVTLATNDLALLTAQTAAAENGVYVVAASGTAVRAAAFATYDAHPGRYFSVMEGTAKHDTFWRCTSDKGGTLGTTALVFGEFGSAGALLIANSLADLTNKPLAQKNLGVREVLTANRTYYVRADLGAATVTIATPGVWTLNAHGLQNNDPFVAYIKPDSLAATMTIASPAVATLNAHLFAAGQPIKWSTTGALPTGVTAGTTYYVIAAGLTANAFQFSATVGGAAVVTSGTQSGTHYVEKTGALPTGVTAGATYFARSVTTNTFEFASLPGGASIATSGTQSGVFNIATGNDGNNGLAATRSGAFFTLQKAIDTVSTLDTSIYDVAAQLADSLYFGGAAVNAPWVGAGNLFIQGTSGRPSNAQVFLTGNGITSRNGSRVVVQNMRITATSGYALYGDGGAIKINGTLEFGASGAAISAQNGGYIFNDYGAGAIRILGAMNTPFIAVAAGRLSVRGINVSVIGTPAWVTSFLYMELNASAYLDGLTWSGGATGQRYLLTGNAVCQTYGGQATISTNYFPGSANGSATGGASMS